MNLYGRLSVNLVEEKEAKLETFAQTINEVIKPPKTISAEDIYVRAIYLVSDQVNSYGGRFPSEELAQIGQMLIDSPVLVGHDKSELPIARNFKAEVLERENGNWIKVWFYWLKDAEGSKALLANIDGGIYKEGSIGFIFSLPECGICGQDIRNCSHSPLKKYNLHNQQITCYYNYRQIEKVLETSLVFRGANPDTRITNELLWNVHKSSADSDECAGSTDNDNLQICFDESSLPVVSQRAYATPLYFGLPVICKTTENGNAVFAGGHKLKFSAQTCLANVLHKLSLKNTRLIGQLFKLRGKQRLPLHKWKEIDRSKVLEGQYHLLITLITDNSGMCPDDEILLQIQSQIREIGNISVRRYQKIDNFQSLKLTSCKSRWGTELILTENGQQKLIQLRSQHYYLLKVQNVKHIKNGRFIYQLSFVDIDSVKSLTTYETKLQAIPGDTLLVQAGNYKHLTNPLNLTVEDNLGHYYQADNSHNIIVSESAQAEYKLHLIKNSGLLHLCEKDQELIILFPQFNIQSLNSGKTLVGYPLGADLSQEHFSQSYLESLPVESGALLCESKPGKRRTICMQGRSLNGKYRTHPACWNKKELILFTKVQE